MYNDLAFYNECTNKRSKATMCTNKRSCPAQSSEKNKANDEENILHVMYSYRAYERTNIIRETASVRNVPFVVFVVFTCGTQERIHCTNNIATAMMTLARHHSQLYHTLTKYAKRYTKGTFKINSYPIYQKMIN